MNLIFSSSSPLAYCDLVYDFIVILFSVIYDFLSIFLDKFFLLLIPLFGFIIIILPFLNGIILSDLTIFSFDNKLCFT